MIKESINEFSLSNFYPYQQYILHSPLMRPLIDLHSSLDQDLFSQLDAIVQEIPGNKFRIFFNVLLIFKFYFI